MPEQRRHVRKSVQVELRCREKGGSGELVFESADLSAGGAFLVSDLLFEQAEELALAFRLPGGHPVRCGARVAWVRRFPASGRPAGMGVEFRDLSEPDQRAIEAFLAR